MDSETEFLYKHQTLTLQLARLPILRRDLQDAEDKVKHGFLGNAAMQRNEYNNCVRWIKDLVGEM